MTDQPTPKQEVTGRMKVFVSYARADLDFVDQLVLALEDKGFTALIDRHNIDAAERWQERLSALIASSDTVVFVLSPTSAASKICQWEVTEAVKLDKRLVPVVPVALKNAEPPAELAALNYIHFYKDDAVPGSGFYDGVRKLERALTVDLGWLRLQTRLNEDVAEWLPQRAEDRLLRGSALDEAVTWLQRAPTGQNISENMRDFIRTSEAAENLRKAEAATRIAEREESLQKLSRRTAVGLVGASGLTVLSGGLAYWGLDAESRFRAERERVAKAEEEAKRKLIETEAARTDIEGQITVYAAAPGEVAMDGDEAGNSPFTTAARAALSDKDISLQQALVRASLSVSRQTRGEQRPYVATNVNGDIYLYKPRAGQMRRAICISVDRIVGYDMALPNVTKDAEAWRGMLAQAGFDVSVLKNPTSGDVDMALSNLMSTQIKQQGFRRHLPNPLLVPMSIGVARRPDADRDFNLMLAVFYAGIGLTHGGQEYLAMADSTLQVNDDKYTVTNVFAISRLNLWMRNKAGLSLLLLDTNFSVVDSVEVYRR